MSSLENYLKELRESSKPLVAAVLVRLADLSREEKEVFSREWHGIDVARRREILERLAELAEDNLELDFDEVNRVCFADADSEVRVRAIEGLMQCEERTLIDPLIALLQGDPEHPVRAAAATALGPFAMLAEFEELSPGDADKVERALTTAFNKRDERDNVRCRALEAVSPISKPQIQELIRQAYQSKSLEFQASALFAMGRNCNRNWLPILLKELRSTNPQLRFEAAQACGELEAEEAVPKLVELSRDSDLEVQLSAIAALGKIGGDRAKEALRECADSGDELISEAAQYALDEMKFWEGPFSL